MNRATEMRLSRLELAGGERTIRPVFRVIGDSAEDCNEHIQDMIKKGQAKDDDFFISRIIVPPPCVRPAN